MYSYTVFRAGLPPGLNGKAINDFPEIQKESVEQISL